MKLREEAYQGVFQGEVVGWVKERQIIDWNKEWPYFKEA